MQREKLGVHGAMSAGTGGSDQPNYKRLLVKYMRYIKDVEGSHFVPDRNPFDDEFTEQEWSELMRIRDTLK